MSEAKETVPTDTPAAPAAPAATEAEAETEAAVASEAVKPDEPTTQAQASTETTAVVPVPMDVVAKDESATNGGTATGELVIQRINHASRRVIVTNIYKFVDAKKVKKMAAEWLGAIRKASPELKMEVDKVKKPPKENWAVLTLKDASMVQPLIDYINNNGITNKKGFKLSAKPADEDESWDDRKRKSQDSDRGDDKRQRTDDRPPARRPVTDDEIRAKVTPMWKLSAQEQKTAKTREMVKRCAMKTVQEIKTRFRALEREKMRESLDAYDWVKKPRCIDLAELVTVPSPLRNKCEFTFGYRYLFDENGDDKKDVADEANAAEKVYASVPEVGFMVTGWSGGVSNPKCCANIPSEACALADVLNGFLTDSPLLPYDSKVHSGFWRTLTIRSSRRTEECMVIIMHAPPVSKDGSVDHSEQFASEKTRLLALLTAAELPVEGQAPLKVTSIFFQEFDGLSAPPPDHPVQHVFGKTALKERLGKCTFQVSPGAFFQVNTEGAEMLYQLVVDKVREVSPDPENTLLFDVCCGTGTIGLTCMKEGAVGRVVGVDISGPAIEDALVNAELNGFGPSGDEKARTRFVAARAEKVLSQEIGKAKAANPECKFVAVVDPAREGLHADVVKALRMNKRIERIVYVSCNPTSTLVRDAGLFCGPPTKRYTGEAFRVVAATPVDMFPLTNHCEMVMTFDRLSVAAANESAKEAAKVDDTADAPMAETAAVVEVVPVAETAQTSTEAPAAAEKEETTEVAMEDAVAKTEDTAAAPAESTSAANETS